jgi:protein SCO1/2
MKLKILLCIFVISIGYALVDVGIDEKLGELISLDSVFYDENNNQVVLKDAINKPTILSLVYFTCPGICNPLLIGLSEVLGKMELTPVKDYNVLSVSFDEMDTTQIAKEKKQSQLRLIKKNFDPNAWKFLSGNKENIKKFTDSVGFKFKKDGKDFIHSAALIIISPKGKIIRYIRGVTFLPFDVQMALTEASKGTPGPTINKILLYCYSYDPIGRKYAFNILKVIGTVTLTVLISFFIFLVTRKKRA